MGTLAEAAASLKHAAESAVAGAHADDRRSAPRRSAAGRPRAAGGKRHHSPPLRPAGACGARTSTGRLRAPARARSAGGGGPRARAACRRGRGSSCQSAPFAARVRCAGSGTGWSPPPSIPLRRWPRPRLAAWTPFCCRRSSPRQATRTSVPSASIASRLWRRRARFPVYALGGIDGSHADLLRGSGAVGIAGIGGLIPGAPRGG